MWLPEMDYLLNVNQVSVRNGAISVVSSVASSIDRTCWIYNLCGSIRIYKNQIHGIDPYADL